MLAMKLVASTRCCTIVPSVLRKAIAHTVTSSVSTNFKHPLPEHHHLDQPRLGSCFSSIPATKDEQKPLFVPQFRFFSLANVIQLRGLATASSIHNPHLRPQFYFEDKIDNSNAPFVPILKHKPNAIVPLDPNSNDHPYAVEIRQFKHLPHHLEPSIHIQPPKTPEQRSNHPLQFIDTPEELTKLARILDTQKEISIDLEFHQFRSYHGFTCIVQISTRTHDYIIDTLRLRSHMHILNSSFTNPAILKLMHGVSMDILFLQKDFGLYIVNLFDTQIASEMLGKGKRSLVSLFKDYCNLDIDVAVKKKFQKADWRIRPLPKDMLEYARSDTHYLFHIYDRMKNELIEESIKQYGNPSKLLMEVYTEGRCACLRKYEKKVTHDIFLEDTGLRTGLLQFALNKNLFLDEQQLCLLEKLFHWRDKVARDVDDSPNCIVHRDLMIEIAYQMPRNVQALAAAVSKRNKHIQGTDLITNVHISKHRDQILKMVEEAIAKIPKPRIAIKQDPRTGKITVGEWLHLHAKNTLMFTLQRRGIDLEASPLIFETKEIVLGANDDNIIASITSSTATDHSPEPLSVNTATAATPSSDEAALLQEGGNSGVDYHNTFVHPKTRLSEICFKHFHNHPTYRTSISDEKEGLRTATVTVPSQPPQEFHSRGAFKTKRDAERSAAEEAIAELSKVLSITSSNAAAAAAAAAAASPSKIFISRVVTPLTNTKGLPFEGIGSSTRKAIAEQRACYDVCLQLLLLNELSVPVVQVYREWVEDWKKQNDEATTTTTKKASNSSKKEKQAKSEYNAAEFEEEKVERKKKKGESSTA